METNDIALSGPRDLDQAKEAQRSLNNYVASQMKEGVDYGVIPGTAKKSIYQPGAQKLLYFHGLGCRFEPGAGTVIDWKAPFFNYEFKAVVFHRRTGAVVAECFGSANSKEPRYAYVWVKKEKVPRGINVNDLITKEVSGGLTLYRIDNQEPFNLPNTLMKMGQKRAMIGASLLACRAAENFTQAEVDEEDAEPAAAKQAPAAARQDKPASGDPPKAPGLGKSVAPSEPISEKQLKRLHAISKVSEEDLKKFLRTSFPYTIDEEGAVSTAKVAWKDYDFICSFAEKTA